MSLLYTCLRDKMSPTTLEILRYVETIIEEEEEVGVPCEDAIMTYYRSHLHDEYAQKDEDVKTMISKACAKGHWSEVNFKASMDGERIPLHILRSLVQIYF
jgi:hypothetical protein